MRWWKWSKKVVCFCHTCTRELENRRWDHVGGQSKTQCGKERSFTTDWGLKLWNAWQNFSILLGAWGHLETGGRGRKNYSYTIQLPTEKSEQIPTDYVLVFSLIFSSNKDTLRMNPHSHSSSSSFSSSLFRLGILGKSSITSGNQLIFIQAWGKGMRGMHWCVETNNGTVCAQEAWYEKEWTLR